MRLRVALCVVLALPLVIQAQPIQAAGALTVSQVSVSESNTGAGASKADVNFILSSAPSADVIINYANNGQCTLGGSTSGALLITSGNSSVSSQLVALNDEVIEGSHTCEFSFSTASSDSQFNGINRIYNATINDNDGQPSLSIVVSEDSHLREGNLSFRNVYSVVRGGEEPTSTLTLTVWTDEQCALKKTSGDGYTSQISQTIQSFAIPIIVVANDDEVAEGDHTCLVQHRVSTSDPAYKDNPIPSRYVTVEDNEAAPASEADSDQASESENESNEAIATANEDQPGSFVGQSAAVGQPIRLQDPDTASNVFVIMTFSSVVVGTIIGWWRFGRPQTPQKID